MQRTWILLAALAPGVAAADDPPRKKYEVISPKPDGIIATGINGKGEIVGFEWVEEEKNPGVVAQVPFFARGKELIVIPLLEGYTATFPAAISDDGLVVGRAGKPAPPGRRVYLRNQAFIWDRAGGIRGLGTLEEDWASFATGVTSDGRRISGYSVGDDRIRACVWDRDGDGWKGAALPQQEKTLGSNVVVISDDGKFAAASDGAIAVLWSLSDDGKWSREAIGTAGELLPRDVNNSGTVVGLQHLFDGTTYAIVRPRGEGCKRLELPPGYAKAEANAINNAGAVVGIMDGPAGGPIGPDAFVYEDGKLRKIDDCGPGFTAANAINDRNQVAGIQEAIEEETSNEEGEDKAGKKPAEPKP